jgi:hypothetical protein
MVGMACLEARLTDARISTVLRKSAQRLRAANSSILTTDVLEPTLMTVFPVKDAVKMTIFGESPETAEVKASSVDTLVVAPPAPPVVLNNI